MSIRAVFFAAALTAVQALATPSLAASPELSGAPASSSGWDGPDGPQDAPHRSGHGRWAERQMAQAPTRHEGECYAKVRYGAQYAPPPSGPEYVWRQAPPPPGAPGPIWCLTVQSLATRPVMISPERYGWIRVLCDDDATPDRISVIQRRLHDRGLYRGEIDGRYDARTAWAVRRFQSERRIEDRGYLGYDTMSALEAPPRPPAYYRSYWSRPTTFDTGVISWPGKVVY